MTFRKQVFFLLASLFCFIVVAEGQTVTVRDISITGIKRTRASIIYRELTFLTGDTLPQKELGNIMERNKNNLLNLGIFNEVVVNVKEWDTEKNTIDVSIDVKESWYIYALPIVELADRNFNVWWNTYNHDFSRLNLGGRLDFLNFTGRNDKLKIKLQFGYTPKQELEYRFPYFGWRQNLGVAVGFLHSNNREVSYASVGNQEQFVQIDDRNLLQRWRVQTNGFYRPNLFVKYELSLMYQRYDVDNQVVSDYNPIYFRNGSTKNENLIMRAAFVYDERDFRIYPSRGIVTQLEIEKIGFSETSDENKLTGRVALEWNNTMGRRFQQRIVGIGFYSFIRSRPSYIYYKALGYGQNYVRGYELYVVDGLDYAIGKYQVAYKLFDTKFTLGNKSPIPQFREMPFRVYLSFALEGGQANDPYTGGENPLANQWLYGGGPGVDFVLYNNFLFQFSVSTNHLGETGFFIHNKTSF
ncbi:MAG TPA: POTRA domain-containing protein [Saprospiraceae bacterium]|nr:POTRA domain-containing protein [Saprospiraceae bacterium]